MRIAVLTDRDSVNSNYRAFPLVALRQRGHTVRLEVEPEKLQAPVLRRFEAAHVYRLRDPATRKLVAHLRESGVAVVWDDDDFTSTPTWNEHAPQSQRDRSDTIRMMRLAHVVTTTSEVLAEQYRSWGIERVRVVENFLPGSYAPPLRGGTDGDVVTIGWTAAAEHVYDLEHLHVHETFKRLLADHPQVRAISIGVELKLPRDRYEHLYRVQYHDLAEQVARFDIGIAPLADIPFNRARSNVKLKEYAAAGVPWLASPVGPYVGFGEKQGGRLVPDDGWYEALERLVLNAKDRRKLGRRGRRWAARETVAKHLSSWEAVLTEALDVARSAGGASASLARQAG